MTTTSNKKVVTTTDLMQISSPVHLGGDNSIFMHDLSGDAANDAAFMLSRNWADAAEHETRGTDKDPMEVVCKCLRSDMDAVLNTLMIWAKAIDPDYKPTLNPDVWGKENK